MEALAAPRRERFAAAADATLRAGVGAAPGLLAALAMAWAASTAGSLFHAPPMLAALLFGMALNPVLASRQAFASGLGLSAKTVLRLGVVLLGARVTVGDILDLGAASVLLAVGGVVLTLSGGWVIGRLLGLKRDHAVLSAGAVAICGASAAMAISSVLPRHADSDRNTTLTIVGVTTLSTIAMVLYPFIATVFGLDHRSAGVFLGASIHDVAQVLGAGFTISPETAQTATVVKLTRIACLAPAVAALGFLFRDGRVGVAGKAPPAVPWFLLGFAALMAMRSVGVINPSSATALVDASQWCLLISVAALGAKTSLKDIFAPGWRPLLALVLQTVLLGVFALAGAWLLR